MGSTPVLIQDIILLHPKKLLEILQRLVFKFNKTEERGGELSGNETNEVLIGYLRKSRVYRHITWICTFSSQEVLAKSLRNKVND